VFEEIDKDVCVAKVEVVLPEEDMEKLKSLFRELCKKHHPDRDPDHVEEFKEIVKCYENKDLAGLKKIADEVENGKIIGVTETKAETNDMSDKAETNDMSDKTDTTGPTDQTNSTCPPNQSGTTKQNAQNAQTAQPAQTQPPEIPTKSQSQLEQEINQIKKLIDDEKMKTYWIWTNGNSFEKAKCEALYMTDLEKKAEEEAYLKQLQAQLDSIDYRIKRAGKNISNDVLDRMQRDRLRIESRMEYVKMRSRV